MMPTALLNVFLLSALLAALLSGAAGAVAPATPVGSAAKPWEATPDMDCDWWLSREDGHSHRASIDQGSGLSMGLSDTAFDTWPQSDHVPVLLRFNHDAKRMVTVDAWVTHSDGAPTMIGFILDARARRALGGATRLEVVDHGKTLVDLPLAATPSAASSKPASRRKSRAMGIRNRAGL